MNQKEVGTDLSLTDDSKTGRLDLVGLSVQVHVSEHHAGRQQQGRGVGLVQARNVRGCAVHLYTKHNKNTKVLIYSVIFYVLTFFVL